MLQAPSPTNATVSPASSPLCSRIGQQVGEQLAGVELVGERVDDRHAGVRRHLVERGLGVGAPHDRPTAWRPSTRATSATDSRLPMPASEPSTIIGLPPSSAMPAANDAWVRRVGLS